MQRFRVLGIIAALMLITALGSTLPPHAIAQDSDIAAHPIVGMWWWENESADPFDDSFAVFGADGTYVEETPFIGAGIGTWVSTGERTADLHFLARAVHVERGDVAFTRDDAAEADVGRFEPEHLFGDRVVVHLAATHEAVRLAFRQRAAHVETIAAAQN